VDFTVNEISSSEKEVEINLKYDEIKSDIESEISKQIRDIQIPGFRKGKVPKHIIKQRYGNALEYEASEKVANKHIWEIAKEKNLNPIGQPVMTDLDFHPGQDFKFKVKFETVPEIKVKDYTGRTIEVPDFVVKDDEIEKEIDYILRANSTTEEAEIVGDNNLFIIDVEMNRLNEKGEPFENTTPEKLQIDLSNENVHPDIKEKAKGKNAGDKFNFSFDDERNVPSKEGKNEDIKEHFDYEVSINGIKRIVRPELNEELIKKVTKDKVTTEEDLRKEIHHDLQHYYDHRVEDFTRNKLISIIIKHNDFTPPSSLVTNILNEMVKSEEERLKKQGAQKINPEEIRKYLEPAAQNDVKWYLLKNEIQKIEKFEVSERELEEMASKDAEKTGLPVEKLLNYYKSSNQNEKLLDKKLFDFLKEKNNIIKVNPDQLSRT